MSNCVECIYKEICLHRENILNDTYAYFGIKYDTENCKDYTPSADVVEVVRCKDCKHFTKGMAIGMCKRIEENPIIPYHFIPCHCEHYCSYGERSDT